MSQSEELRCLSSPRKRVEAHVYGSWAERAAWHARKVNGRPWPGTLVISPPGGGEMVPALNVQAGRRASSLEGCGNTAVPGASGGEHCLRHSVRNASLGKTSLGRKPDTQQQHTHHHHLPSPHTKIKQSIGLFEQAPAPAFISQDKEYKPVRPRYNLRKQTNLVNT